jgi:hypothetical protein
MDFRPSTRICFTLIFLIGILAAEHSRALETISTVTNLNTKTASLTQIPLHFEVNQGQVDEQVKFLSRGRGYSLFLTPNEAVLSLSPTPELGGAQHVGQASRLIRERASASTSSRSAVIRMKLIDANPSPKVEGLDEFSGHVNYFKGNDPAKWRTNMVTYACVRYENVYPGVDLIYYGNQRQLEYDLIVAPGADPSSIRLNFDGAEKVQVAANGDLVLHTAGGEVRQHKPLIYQLVDGERREIEGGYLLREAVGVGRQAERDAAVTHEVAFKVGAHDPSRALIIDPVLSYSTYLGGGGFDSVNGIAVDSFGNAYVVGWTSSADFPVVNAMDSTLDTEDVFVTKLNPIGSTMIYSTYIGGTSGDYGYAIALDTAGNAYVTGVTGSSDFPTINGLLQPINSGAAFVSKLSADGSSLIYSGKYVPDSVALSIAVDGVGSAYLTGRADGNAAIPIVNAVQPNRPGGVYTAFVTKLNPAGTGFEYSSFLGGNERDDGLGIAVDSAGSAYVAGVTFSTNFPTLNAFQPRHAGGGGDMFLAKLNPVGSAFVYSTYLGGKSGESLVGAVTVDSTGHAFVTGQTASTDFPITPNASQTAGIGLSLTFVTKFSVDGQSLVYSTLFGGWTQNWPNGIAVDAAGNAFVTGGAETNYYPAFPFPLVNSFQNSFAGGSADAFVAKLDPDGSTLLFSTYLGGAGSNEKATGIAVDAAGNAYVSGATDATNFPMANAIQPNFGGGASDGFVAKILADPDAAPPRILFAISNGDSNWVEVVFSEPLTEALVTNLANYSIDNGVAITAATLGTNSRTVRLATTPLQSSIDYTITVSNVQDRALPVPNAILPNSQFLIDSLVPGKVTRKIFTDIEWPGLEDLTSNVKFPNQPDSVSYIDSFETPVDVLDNYGVQLQALLVPPLTSDYTFYVNSDDEGALYLSADENPTNKILIAREPQRNPPRNWINGANQASRGIPPANISAPVHLEGGRKYYLEALMKEGEGGDNLAVAWRIPGGVAIQNGVEPIVGKYLLARRSVGRPTVVLSPQSQSVTELQAITFSILVDGSSPLSFQWFKNGELIAGATSPTYTLPAAPFSDNGAVFTVSVSNASGSATSNGAVLTVNAETTPPILVRARSVTLEKVEVTFSEPVTQGTATNRANYAIGSAGGNLAITSAALSGDPAQVILATDRQTELTEYTLTVNGIRDTSVAGNAIAMNSQAKFTPFFENEFIGPFPSWANLKTKYGAIGDGIADDTTALQKALDELGTNGPPNVLYVPAGTYRITQGLQFFSRIGVSVLGEDPATTMIKWDGPSDGIMIWCNGVSISRFGRLTFDGANRALSAVDQKWDGQRPYAPNRSEYADMVFQDVQYGIRAGIATSDDTVAVLRCRFLRCSKAGAGMQSFNVIDWNFWQCLFEDCRVGVSSDPGAGQFNVYESIFRNSIETDLRMGPGAFFSVRDNYSIGSRAFFIGPFTGNPMAVTIQGNIILDPKSQPIHLENQGPHLVIDNVIRSRPDQTGPVVHSGHDDTFQSDLISIGNAFTVTNPLSHFGRLLTFDDQVVDHSTINPVEPVLPTTLPNLNRPFFEVPSGANAATIQQAIDAAAQLPGQRPVVHIPAGTYFPDKPLKIPAGADLQLVGDGYGYTTFFDWTGDEGEAVLRLSGPSRATLRDFTIRDFRGESFAIVVENCDQPGARFFGEQFDSNAPKTHGLLVDRLDHTRIEMRDINQGFNNSNQASIKVVGGPLRANGQPAESKANIFGGDVGGDGLMYDVQDGGQLLVRDTWFEGATTRFMRLNGSGVFTLHGAMIALYAPVSNATVEIDDFRGQATILETYFTTSNLRVTGDGQATKVLGLGLAGNLPNYFTNDSPNAQVMLLGSRTSNPDIPVKLPIPNYTNQVSSMPEFVRQMLAQTRSERPQKLTPLPDGVTDVRLYRVSVEGPLVGILLTKSNAAPSLAEIPDQVVNEGDTLTFTNIATDAVSLFNTFRFNLGPDSPPGAAINPTNGVFMWTPTEAQGPSTNLIRVIVTDDGFPPLSATNVVTVIVNEANSPPSLAFLPGVVTLVNPSFEADNFTVAPGYVSGNGPITGWSSAGAAGVNPGSFGGPFSDNGRVPHGSKVAFIQENSALKQTVHGLVPGGKYLLRFYENARAATARPHLAVTFGGNEVVSEHEVTPVGGDNPYHLVISPLFTAAAAEVELAFIKSDPSGSDSTVLLDAIDLVPEEQYEWSVDEGSTVTLLVSASDDDLPVQHLSLRLAPGAPDGAKIDAATSVFSWTPSEAQGPGVYPITVVVTDDGTPPLSATNRFTVTVNEVNVAPVLAAISDRTVNAGELLSFTNTASDEDLPANVFTFSLDDGAPVGASIEEATGVFKWTPTAAQAQSTNTMTARVTDNGMPPLSDAKTFRVVVYGPPVELRIVGTPSVVDGNFSFTWQAQAGRTYRVQYKSDLDPATSWSDLPDSVTATGPTATYEDKTNGNAGQGFYRVRVE